MENQIQTRTAKFQANSARDEDRSIEAVIATDEPCMMWRTMEVLRMDGITFPEKITLLDTHNRDSVKDILGSTRDFAIEQGEPSRLVARNYFCDTADGRDAYQKAKEGHLTDNSVGYRNLKWITVEPGQSQIIQGKRYDAGKDTALRVVTKWELAENSACPIGADKYAKNRAEGSETNNYVAGATRERKTTMDEQTKSSTVESDIREMQRIADENRMKEKKRISDIQDLCARHKIDEAIERKFILEDKTVDEVRAMILDIVSNRKVDAPAVCVAGDLSNTDAKRAVAAGVLMRAGTFGDEEAKDFGDKVTDGAKQFRDMSLIDICRVSCELENKPVSRNREELIRVAASTATLPYILGAVAYKSLIRGYNAQPTNWQKLANVSSVSNFLAHTRIRLFDVGELETVPNGGEFKHGSLAEEYEQTTIATKGKKLVIGRNAFINDDLQALTKIPQGMGQKAAIGLNKLFWTHVLANGNMSDGTALFVSGHANLNTSSALTATTLGAARKAFMAQTDGDGTPIGITPKYLVVPPSLYVTAKELMESQLVITAGIASSSTASKMPNANIWKGAYEIIEEPLLELSTMSGYSATSWYLWADPTFNDTIDVAFLNGRQEPVIEQWSNEPDYLGVIFRIYFDAGVKALDWRTMQLNQA